MNTPTQAVLPQSSLLLLEQELNCFHEIMAKTQEVLDDSDSMSLTTILNLLDVRDHWIERLKDLEAQKVSLNADQSGVKESKLGKQISAIAKSLVVTDARLFDILQVKKMNVVKEMGKIADNRGEATNAMKNVQQPTIIDTRSI